MMSYWMGSMIWSLWTPSRRLSTFVYIVYSMTIVYFLSFYFIPGRKPRPEDQIQYTITEKTDKRLQKAHVNGIFFAQLKELLSEYSKSICVLCELRVCIIRVASDDDMCRLVKLPRQANNLIVIAWSNGCGHCNQDFVSHEIKILSNNQKFDFCVKWEVEFVWPPINCSGEKYERKEQTILSQ